MKRTLLSSILVLSLFSSCKKDAAPAPQPLSVASVNNTIVTGNWRVTYYNDNSQDETTKFSGYEFDFAAGGIVTATKTGSSISGTWSSGNDDSQVKLILSFSAPAVFSEISDDWHVTERTDTKITLQDVSGGNGGTDYLTFERN
jgi:hypothetical protein